MNDINLMIEECSELIQACCKYKRLQDKDKTLRCTSVTVENMMKEEIADVGIVLSRLIEVFFKDFVEYNNFVNMKLDRTKKLNK